jgi:hypothetical protein
MTAGPQRYALRCVRSPQELAAYHAIRRQAIFAALLPGQAYDETDPDEVAPGNFPHVLLHDGKIVGAISLDQAEQAFAWWASGAISSGKGTVASCSGLRKTPHAVSAKPRSSSMPADLASRLPCQRLSPRRMGDAGPFPATFIRVGGAIAVMKASRRSPTAGREFHTRGVAVTAASNRPQSPPLRGH